MVVRSLLPRRNIHCCAAIFFFFFVSLVQTDGKCEYSRHFGNASDFDSHFSFLCPGACVCVCEMREREPGRKSIVMFSVIEKYWFKFEVLMRKCCILAWTRTSIYSSQSTWTENAENPNSVRKKDGNRISPSNGDT